MRAAKIEVEITICSQPDRDRMANGYPIICPRDATRGVHRGKICSYDKHICREDCLLGMETTLLERMRKEIRGLRKSGYLRQKVDGRWRGSITCALHASPRMTDPDFVPLALHDPSCHWADQPCIFIGNLKWFRPTMDCLIMIITHEMMHCVLGEVESIRAELQWENVASKVIDLYDESIGELLMSISKTKLEEMKIALHGAYPNCLELKSYEERLKLIKEQMRKKYPSLWRGAMK